MVAVSYPGASAERPGRLGPDHPGAGHQRRTGHALHGLRRHQCRRGTIQIIFEPGTDPNVAVLNVNNRIHIVKNRLPPIVEREGIIVMQAMTSMLMYVNVYSTEEGVDQNFLYNYVTVNILPEIKRVRGVGTAKILGNRAYAMRILLNLDRMRAYNVSVRRRHEGCGETEHDRLARTTRPGHGQDVANRRVRPDLGGTLQQAGTV